MAPVLKTMPGRVSAHGRKKSPKKGRSGSSRRGKKGKRVRSPRTTSKESASSRGSSKRRKGRGKKGKHQKMISPEEYGEMQQELKSSSKTQEMLNIKFMAMSHSREEYRKCAFSLLDENEHIQRRLIKVERECIEVVGYLHQKRGAHEARLEVVETELAEIRQVEGQKRNALAASYEAKLRVSNEIIENKNITMERLKYEVRKLKGLEDTNVKLEHENEVLNKELLDTMVRHQNQLVEYEAMILREKRDLEQLARKEVHNLVEAAHEMAAKNVGATTANVYDQNNCLNLTLAKYQREVSSLERVAETNQRRAKKAETRADIAEAALRQMRRQLTTLQRAADQLQQQLTRSETDRLQEAVSLQDVRAELRDWTVQERERDQHQAQQLRRQLAVREATVRRLRRLARRVLARRSQLEDFFLSALDHVSGQAADERRQYWKDAEREYRQQMAAGLSGAASQPDVMTLDGNRTSSRDIADGWRLRNEWRGDFSQVDVSALTWPQKESVLRVLFAHINGMLGKVRQRKKNGCPRKKTADVGVQKFGGQKRRFSGKSIGGYPILSPFMDKSIQMFGL